MLIRLRLHKAAVSFVHPLDPAPRTAILVPGFESTRSIRVFPRGWNDAVRKFAPACVAGSYRQLHELAGQGIQLTHAVICLCWDKRDLLTPGQRDFLWTAFGVPVFEQYLGRGNMLLAYECEAHSALHATAAYSGPTLDQYRCPCGSILRSCFAPQEAMALRPTA